MEINETRLEAQDLNQQGALLLKTGNLEGAKNTYKVGKKYIGMFKDGDPNVAHTDCCIGRGLAAIHSKNNHQSFVLYTMFSLKKQLDVFNGEGTVFGSINRNSLNEMPILIPSSEKLDEFEALVAPMDVAIRNNYDEICRLEQLRDSLLPKLMSGELDVSDIDL